MDQPVTRYARTPDGAYIAYQVFGEGPTDLLLIYEWVSHQELRWEQPHFARFLNRLSAHTRVVTFDKRGCGLSDPAPLGAPPPLESWAEDVSVVLDAAGIERCAVMGAGAGGPMAMVYAATHPERVSALVLANTTARYARAPDYPMGLPPAVEEQMRVINTSLDPAHGNPGPLSEAMFGKKLGRDEALVAWFGRHRRYAASPSNQVTANLLLLGTDVRGVLAAISVPTLVVHREDDNWTRVDNGRFLAEHIPGARLVVLPGDEHAAFVGDIDSLVGEVEEFLLGARQAASPERVLATILFTDMVDSTARAADRGDLGWRYLLEAHDAVGRAEVVRHRGRVINTTGDGFLATFDGPGRAIQCAQALSVAARGLGVEIRAGVHTGEVETVGDDIAGIAVHIAARVMANAGPGEVLVSSSVPPLVAGSGIDFVDRGEYELKGVPGSWRLFAVVN
jgi:pimeloyl-ACP methyl ester carboxylesterase